MHTRFSKMKWAALCTGVLLLSAPGAPAEAGNWFRGKTNDECLDQTTAVDCPVDVSSAGGKECKLTRCQLRRARCQYGSACFLPTDRFYCDSRDLRVYSAVGYGVPVTVPLAPGCRTYNYGWGIPSSRLTQAGSYAAWQPDRPFSQSGGRLPGGIYPTVYHPTDTTQNGYYYNYVPTWQPRRW